jgi:hypothetical protein
MWSIFPFFREFDDSTVIYRYSKTDSNGNITVNAVKKILATDSIVCQFVFKEAVGGTSVNSDGGWSTEPGSSNLSLQSYTLTSVKEFSRTLPLSYQLFQNFPNPFNGTTQIRFQIPRMDFVVITLFDVLGRKISTLFQGVVQSGLHTVSASFDALPSGVYFYEFKSRLHRETRKLVLIK